MRIDRTTVAGNGVLHHIAPRRGGRFGLLVDADNTRQFFTYEGSDLDVPAQAILLEPDEADQLAEILHSQPIADRLVSLERRVGELIGKRGHDDHDR
jgi:K+/H+ antiporter YhaU regulatory subunit KhtT